jgi:hypothetical protein
MVSFIQTIILCVLHVFLHRSFAGTGRFRIVNMSNFKSDHNIIRDYVTGADHLQYTNLPDGVVCILMTHSNLPTKHMDVRL